VRAVYVWDWELFVSIAALAWRMQARAERRAGPVARPRMAVIVAGSPPHASTPLFDIPTEPETQTEVLPAGLPLDAIRERLAASAPTHLVGYASVIARLAKETLAGRLDIRPGRVSTNSEPLPADGRAAIVEAWGATVHNLWGSTEIGVQAVGCGVGEGLHVCEDEVVLERTDGDGRPVPADEPATRTLVTGLANRTFPFIRYDLGDQVTPLLAPCRCGSLLSRIADVEGREDDDFRYGDVVVPAIVFRHVLGADPRIVEYQVRQTARGAEVLVVAPAAGGESDTWTAVLANGLCHHGLRSPQVDVRIVERLERNQRTGKLKRFVPLGA
jgi:phenylacetate-coenzyme A ligase PaaK-like adenylate-forming protein